MRALSACKLKAMAMSFEGLTFQIVGNDGSARNGLLRHAHGRLQTPALLLYTKRGSPLYLTPDMMQHVGEGRTQLHSGHHKVVSPLDK